MSKIKQILNSGTCKVFVFTGWKGTFIKLTEKGMRRNALWSCVLGEKICSERLVMLPKVTQIENEKFETETLIFSLTSGCCPLSNSCLVDF